MPAWGLVLTIKPDKAEARLSFAFEEWKRLYKHLHLDSPALCLVQIASAKPLDEQ